MEIIKIDNVVKIYNAYKDAKEDVALDGINIDIKNGDFVGIMGPSGSGKTTLLNILSGVDKPTSGEIIIKDQSINDMSKDKLALFRRKNIGYIFQDFNLLDSLTLKENIAIPLILDKLNPNDVENRVKELMKLFDIYDLANKYSYNVSGGQKQKVAVARALVNNPSVIFADEPTGNLDSKSTSNIMNIISNINKEIKSTVLMVTHDPFAASFCNRIVFIKDGKVKMEIASSGNRKDFFDRILEVQSVIGGE
ncbi:ABC transporter ATP-binding protein [Romboutsia sedimentorum]|uniref:ABC transporter ATP-binding protein n=1 Tax=Romboutsia sedimentorum TaxID=1368474 RepID=UPI0024DF00F4|nr:ABC transporter ATP-binding protein [Romboutsia sedimentorum]MDK2587051.1 ABC transporter ATP-binding protein [Romboutsia sedimentorum]